MSISFISGFSEFFPSWLHLNAKTTRVCFALGMNLANLNLASLVSITALLFSSSEMNPISELFFTADVLT